MRDYKYVIKRSQEKARMRQALGLMGVILLALLIVGLIETI